MLAQERACVWASVVECLSYGAPRPMTVIITGLVFVPGFMVERGWASAPFYNVVNVFFPCCPISYHQARVDNTVGVQNGNLNFV